MHITVIGDNSTSVVECWMLIMLIYDVCVEFVDFLGFFSAKVST